MACLIDNFLPRPDKRGRHEITIRAPAPLVMQLARTFDLQSVPLVRTIFWLRAKLLRARAPGRAPRGLVEETTRLGWGVLAEQPDRLYVAGAACQPWKSDVVFTPIAADLFAAYSEPDQVKIVWTLEAEPLGEGATRFATETRVAATDEVARRKFRRYWLLLSPGIILIRILVLSALRSAAERAIKAESSVASPVSGRLTTGISGARRSGRKGERRPAGKFGETSDERKLQ